MALHAAAMVRLDRSIGVLVDGLKERGVLDNTLLLFLSDNGASDEGGLLGKFGPGTPGDAQSEVYFGRAWANGSNTPFRLYKKNSREGGIATPLIAYWPAGISALGQWCSQPAHVIDLMDTHSDIAGATYPKTYNGKPIQPLEGVLLKPLCLSPSENLPKARSLYWEHMGHAAVRDGDMKLVRQGRNGLWELYDMAADRTELNNLVTQYPDQAKVLTEKWEAWAERAQVNPYPSEK